MIYLRFLLIVIVTIGVMAEPSFSAGQPVTAGVPVNFTPQYMKKGLHDKPVGFAIDIMDEIAMRAGLAVSYKVYESWPAVLQAIQDGQVDVIPILEISTAREKIVWFTAPLEAFNLKIVVRQSTGDIGEFKDLRTKTVGVVMDNIGESFMARHETAMTVQFRSLEVAFVSLLSANIDALVYPEPPLMAMARKTGMDGRVKAVGPALLEIKRAVGVRKDREELFRQIDTGVASLLKDSVFSEIYAKWYGRPSWYFSDGHLFFLGGGFIVLVICLLVFWRYKSIVHLNVALNRALERRIEVENALKDEQNHLLERIEERTKALRSANEKLQREMVDGKAKAASLERSEAQLKEAQKVAKMGHWTLDLTTNSLAWSDEIFRIFELDEHEFGASYEAFLEVVHPDDLEVVDTTFKQSIKDKVPYDLVHRLLMKNGRVKWIHEKALVHYDRNGIALNAIGTVQDITVMKESEARFLREVSRTTFLLELHKIASDLTDEALYHFTLEYAVELTDSQIGYLHRVNEDQETITLTAWNRNAQKTCKAVYDTHYPLDQAGLWADSVRLKRPVIHNDYKGYDARHGYPEGHVPIDRHMSIPVVEGGKVRLVIGVGNKNEEYSKHDVNMLQVIANELQIIIEHQQVEKEKDRMEMQLRQAQKMESIGTLAGGIAHDFNNILTIILGYSEIIRGAIPPDSHAMIDLENVIIAGNRAKDLVRQILTFSRQSENEFYPLKIQLILSEVLKFLRSSIPTTITIESAIEKDCGDVMADPIQIHQLVMNLCTNAFHAMREDGGLLKISLAEVHLSEEDLGNKLDLTPGSYVRISVSDTGKGMDHLTLSRIFDPYFTTKSKGEGTGLGLAIVHGIVQNIGGTITVYSEVGIGTTFHAYLPVTQPRDKADVHVGQKKIPCGKEHILIVDDEPMIAKMLDKSLTDLGYQTTMHTNSREALYHYRNANKPFELVITDMTMPHMTGAELARHILSIRKAQPIILCTGFSELIDEEKAREIGFRAFLMKPIIKSDIATIVRHVLDETTAHNGLLS